MKSIIYVMHHAPTAKRRGQIIGSRTDLPLSEYGEQTARRMATWLKRGISNGTLPNFRCIITSPLARAKETATILAEECGLPVTTDDRLRAQDFGALDGLTFDEIRADATLSGNLWDAIAAKDRESHIPPDGESNVAFVERIARAAIFMAGAGPNVLHILHGTVIDALIAVTHRRCLYDVEGTNRAFEGQLMAFDVNGYRTVANSLAPVSHIPGVVGLDPNERKDRILRYAASCERADERIYLQKLMDHHQGVDDRGNGNAPIN